MSEITCSFCRGTGIDPFGILSWSSKCCVCNGKGVVEIQEPYRVCAHCGGTGSVKTFTCTGCMGKGYVPLPPSPVSVCPECRGSGDDSSNPYLTCIKCHGRGFVPLGRTGSDTWAAVSDDFSTQGSDASK